MPLTPNVAWSEAIARSQVATSWQPAAVAMPSTSAITGFGSATMDCIRREQVAKVSSKKPLPPSGSARCAVISLRSWPPENTFPTAPRTTTRTVLSSRARSSSACSAAMTPSDSALAGGLASVRRKMPPACSTITGPSGSARRIARISAMAVLSFLRPRLARNDLKDMRLLLSKREPAARLRSSARTVAYMQFVCKLID